MGTRVEAGPKTLFAEPGDLEGWAHGLDRILRQHLPIELNKPHVRVRMSAAASWAGGWLVGNIWRYNAWGIRKGGWTGDYYGMKAPEYNSQGELIELPADKSFWRAYGSWGEAVADYVKVLSQDRYKAGFESLQDPREEADHEWFAKLGEGGWYTDTRKGEEVNRILGARAGRIRAMLADEPESLLDGQSGEASTIGLVLLFVGLVAVVALVTMVIR